jgi:hypothetical protein
MNWKIIIIILNVQVLTIFMQVSICFIDVIFANYQVPINSFNFELLWIGGCSL